MRRSGSTGEVIVGPGGSVAWIILLLPVFMVPLMVVTFAAPRPGPLLLGAFPALIGAIVVTMVNRRYVRSVDIGVETIVVSRRCGPWNDATSFRRDAIDGWNLAMPPWILDPYYPDVRLWGRGYWTVALGGPRSAPCVVADGITLP